jgi:hypothetical protein
MRNIYDIIKELSDHPDYLGGLVFTIDDAIDHFNAEYNSDDEPFNKELLSNDDLIYVKSSIEDYSDEVLYDNNIIPSIKDLPSFYNKDIDSVIKQKNRDLKLNKILQ